MAFNTDEQAIIQAGLRAGKNRAEIETAITNYRLGVKPQPKPQPKPTYLDKVSEAASTGVSRIKQGFEQAKTDRSVLSPVESGIKVGEGAIGTILSPLAPITEPIQKGMGAVADKISDIPAVQRFADTKAGNVASRVAEDVSGLSTIAGFASGGVSARAVKALTPSEEFLATTRRTATQVPKSVPKVTPNIITDIRYALSDIDPQVETVLQRSSFDEVNKYFQEAKNAAKDPAKATPLELAGQRAESAYEVLNKARSLAVQGKKTILNEVGDQRISGNTLNDVLSGGIQRLGDRFGAKIEANGTITQAKGRTLQLDPADQKLVSEYVSRLNSLGIAPTLRQVDDFVDWAQAQLYKQSKTVSKYEVASEPVISELRQMTGELNTRLKSSVGNGYGEVNARIQGLIELQDELNRALGADARKGAGLMKRLFSPAGGDTRRIFEQIKRETGIDLFKEATLAKFAMENIGDTRQSSLLKSLDIAIKGSRELDITKPMTWLNFLRENADLDAQQLANEVIRRASDASK